MAGRIYSALTVQGYCASATPVVSGMQVLASEAQKRRAHQVPVLPSNTMIIQEHLCVGKKGTGFKGKGTGWVDRGLGLMRDRGFGATSASK